jgi:hypothetical protein
MRTIRLEEFQSPFGLLGRIVDRLVLDLYMSHLLRRRNGWLKATLEGPS